jgi:uncharacterized repeat protein (TIGR03837 family)
MQLASEHGYVVRVFADDLAPFAFLADLSQVESGRLILQPWANAENVQPADLVIATFCCDLPSRYTAAMKATQPAPRWMNLEYLSAEPWVESHHGLPSTKPNGLIEYFFYPGFTAKTGGLIRERSLIEWMDVQSKTRLDSRVTISFFAYPSPVWPALIAAWSQSDDPILVLIPEGALSASLSVSQETTIGAVTLRPIPLSNQRGYDALLARCDFNIVRGEDSFVRAQWAGRPFLWHIYPTDDRAHFQKHDAFVDRFVTQGAAETATRESYFALTRAVLFKDSETIGGAWREFWKNFERQKQLALRWRAYLEAQPDLANTLLSFSKKAR